MQHEPTGSRTGGSESNGEGTSWQFSRLGDDSVGGSIVSRCVGREREGFRRDTVSTCRTTDAQPAAILTVTIPLAARRSASSSFITQLTSTKAAVVHTFPPRVAAFQCTFGLVSAGMIAACDRLSLPVVLVWGVPKDPVRDKEPL